MKNLLKAFFKIKIPLVAFATGILYFNNHLSKKALCESYSEEKTRFIINTETEKNKLSYNKLMERINYLAIMLRDITLEYKNLNNEIDENLSYHEPDFVIAFVKEEHKEKFNRGIKKEEILNQLQAKLETLLRVLQSLEEHLPSREPEYEGF